MSCQLQQFPNAKIVKKPLKMFISILIILVYVSTIYGQTVLNNVDSIAFFMPNMHKNSLRFLTEAADISELFVWGGNLYQFSDGGEKVRIVIMSRCLNAVLNQPQ